MCTTQRRGKDYYILVEKFDSPPSNWKELGPVDHWLGNGSWKNRVILARRKGVWLFCRVSAPEVSWHQRAPACKACLFPPSLLRQRGAGGKRGVGGSPCSQARPFPLLRAPPWCCFTNTHAANVLSSRMARPSIRCEYSLLGSWGTALDVCPAVEKSRSREGCNSPDATSIPGTLSWSAGSACCLRFPGTAPRHHLAPGLFYFPLPTRLLTPTF